MKLTATLTMDEVEKMISSYVKKKTGKKVEDIEYIDNEFCVHLGTEDDAEE